MSRLTSLPVPARQEPPQPENLARDIQQWVGQKLETAMAPVNTLNLALAKATLEVLQVLPKFPAARLYADIVFGWPHIHTHPPNLIPPAPPIPLPSFGPVICAGAVSVLINGLPAARVGDVGFGVWCGGYFPAFEVMTGSSHVFIGGARPARQLIDFTRHCMKSLGPIGLGKMGVAMMTLSAGMGALGVAADLKDASDATQASTEAASDVEAAGAAASAAASGTSAVVGALQTAADLAAAAIQAGMGLDPGQPQPLCLGNFLTGSPNVLIGGFPMPGWLTVLRGLGKLLRGFVRVRVRFGRSCVGCG